jgi:hypothetical protein
MVELPMVVAIAALMIGAVALGKSPPRQGRGCDARSKCEAGLQCVAHRDGKSTCELICASNAAAQKNHEL